MSEKRYVVPEEALKAVHDAENSDRDYFDDGDAHPILLAFVRWLAKNPVVPTLPQLRSVESSAGHEPLNSTRWLSDVLTEWQRRMFLAPEPAVPEAIKDLLEPVDAPASTWLKGGCNESVMEAYRRGREEKGSAF